MHASATGNPAGAGKIMVEQRRKSLGEFWYGKMGRTEVGQKVEEVKLSSKSTC